MLKEYGNFFKSIFFILDLLILSLAWIFSYVLRFYTKILIPPILGTPDFYLYIKFLPVLLILWSFFSKKLKLYRPRRLNHFFKEFIEVGTCLTLSLILLISIIYFFRKFEFSRLAFFYFWVMGIFGLISVRYFIRKTLKILRKRGYNQRFALIAGTGEVGKKVLEKIKSYPELGIQIIGFLTSKLEEVGKTIHNIPVLGLYDEVKDIFRKNKIDIFFIAISIHEYNYFKILIERAQEFIPEIKVIPGSYEFFKLRGGLDELEDLPIISILGSPLYGWNRVFKRAFDLILGAFILIMVFPLMMIIALLIKLTSKGPIFYKQERMGMDGRTFQMLKFRTMRVDAEKETGPVWAKENDPRRTKIGAFLRKTSLDELPQLLNVLKGEMSLVGPRPERPYFVEEFRKEIPSYMLRHKIKAGMTGWAQVNGWRGNTSIEKRIEHDLYYIDNWSIGFDLKILLMTLWKGFFNKSAY